jgi:hypothetical protein
MNEDKGFFLFQIARQSSFGSLICLCELSMGDRLKIF